MVKQVARIVLALIGIVTLVLSTGSPERLFAADQNKTAKKQKAAPEAKVTKPKAQNPKFQTAETVGKATACFGDAPKIEKLTPDEGKAGDTVTIKGTQFGSHDCLRGVSFGPGHAAKFSAQNETTITATVPTGGRKGLAIVTVTTASGEDSKPFLIK